MPTSSALAFLLAACALADNPFAGRAPWTADDLEELLEGAKKPAAGQLQGTWRAKTFLVGGVSSYDPGGEMTVKVSAEGTAAVDGGKTAFDVATSSSIQYKVDLKSDPKAARLTGDWREARSEWTCRLTEAGYLVCRVLETRPGHGTVSYVGLVREDGARPIEWVGFPAASFEAGYQWERNAGKCGGPRRRVDLEPFQLSRAEITVSQYARCVTAGYCEEPRRAPAPEDLYCNWGRHGREHHPVNCITWNQAKAFADWAKARLPTAAEWEYAARAGGRSQRFPWGDSEPSCGRAVVNFSRRGSAAVTTGCRRMSTWPVCSKPHGFTPQGLCDMVGNAAEWVQDRPRCRMDEAPRDGQAWEELDDQGGARRALMGGSFTGAGGHETTSSDRGFAEDAVVVDAGFRLARDGLPD